MHTCSACKRTKSENKETGIRRGKTNVVTVITLSSFISDVFVQDLIDRVDKRTLISEVFDLVRLTLPGPENAKTSQLNLTSQLKYFLN